MLQVSREFKVNIAHVSRLMRGIHRPEIAAEFGRGPLVDLESDAA